MTIGNNFDAETPERVTASDLTAILRDKAPRLVVALAGFIMAISAVTSPAAEVT